MPCVSRRCIWSCVIVCLVPGSVRAITTHLRGFSVIMPQAKRSPISTVPRNLTPWMRARGEKAQRVEAVIACNILNRMIELGRPESYSIGM